MRILEYHYSSAGGRRVNEDSFAFRSSPDGAIAVVADGLGGHGGGDIASAIAVNTLTRRWGEKRLPSEEEIRENLEEINRQILAGCEKAPNMKTTVAVLYLSGNRAIWAHIGDSRLYHFYRGNLKEATQDHSVGQLAVNLGEILPKDIPNYPNRSRLTKALGMESVVPEIHPPIALSPGRHAFLLCSDGLWERLYDEEIMLDLHKSSSPEQWVTSLRCRAEARKSTDVDNNTAIAIFLTEE